MLWSLRVELQPLWSLLMKLSTWCGVFFEKLVFSFQMSYNSLLIWSKWIMSCIHSLLVKPSSYPTFTSITWIKYDITAPFPYFRQANFLWKASRKEIVSQIFRKTNISYPLIYTRMVRIRGSEMFVFWKMFYTR